MKQGLFAVAAAIFFACAPAAAQHQGITADAISIGVHGPITGPAAYSGLAGRDGMSLAIKEINAAGGVYGRKLVSVFEDDGHSPSRALAAVKKLVEQDKVFAVVSVGGSNATVGAVDYLKEKGLVYYVSLASAPQVTWPFSRTMFRGSAAETARYGELYADFLATHYNAKRIAIMSGREEYPRNEADATTSKLKDWFQVAPVARAEFSIGDKDFTPQLFEVQKSNPEVIAFFGNPAEGAVALRQAREMGLRQPFFVGANMVDPSFLGLARNSAEGIVGFSGLPVLPGTKVPDMEKWEAAWRKEYPNAPAGRPNVFDILSYGETYVLAEALKRAGASPTTDGLIRALEGLQNYRVSSIVTPRGFTAKHHIGNMTLVPMMAKGGQWEAIPSWTASRPSDILKRYN